MTRKHYSDPRKQKRKVQQANRRHNRRKFN